MSATRIAETTAPEVARRLAAGAAILLPMGSTETHGPALPMGDYLFAEAIAARIAEAAIARGDDALVAPPIPFGGEDYFTGIPGGVTLSSPLLQAVIEEAAEQFRRHAARILFVNGHGGNIHAVEAAARSLRRKHGLVIPTLHLWRSAGALHAELGGAKESFGHGGDPVLSVALHLRPDLCRPDQAGPRRPAAPFLGLAVAGYGSVAGEGAEFAVPIEAEEVAPGGVFAADPRGASAAHGARIVERLAAAGAAMLAQLKGHAA